MCLLSSLPLSTMEIPLGQKLIKDRGGELYPLWQKPRMTIKKENQPNQHSSSSNLQKYAQLKTLTFASVLITLSYFSYTHIPLPEVLSAVSVFCPCGRPRTSPFLALTVIFVLHVRCIGSVVIEFVFEINLTVHLYIKTKIANYLHKEVSEVLNNNIVF